MLLAVILVLLAVQALVIVRSGAPLGHDEAVQALRARDFLRGDVLGWYGRTRLIDAAGLAMSSAIVDASVQVQPDVPGAAVGLLAVALYAWSLSRERLTAPVMLAIGALTGIATLIRFGAPIPIGVGLVAVTIWQHECALSTWRRVIAAAAIASVIPAAILLIPA